MKKIIILKLSQSFFKLIEKDIGERELEKTRVVNLHDRASKQVFYDQM